MPRSKTDPIPAIQELARSFTGLGARRGIDPWEPEALDTWAIELVMHRRWALLAAAKFVLSVWDRGRRWRCGRFDVVSAMAVWDEADRTAFLAWATNPWWAEGGVRRKPKRSPRPS